MAALTGKCGLASSLNGESSEQPLEKESLQSADLEKGISFFKDQCVIRVANRLELRQKAYEYIHKIYLSEGYIKKENCGLRLSIFDALPETTTLVAEKNNGELGGTLTAVFDSLIGLPADELYKKELDEIRNSNQKIIEIISFGIEGKDNDSIKILAGLFYCVYLLAWRIKKTSNLVINVTPDHGKFYCEKLLFRKIGPEKKCPRVNGTEGVLLSLPLRLTNELKKQMRIFPLHMFKFSDHEEMKLANTLSQMLMPMSDEEFYTFFIEKTDVWKQASTLQKEYLKNIYPPYRVNHFSVSRALARGFAQRYSDSGDIQSTVAKISNEKN